MLFSGPGATSSPKFPAMVTFCTDQIPPVFLDQLYNILDIHFKALFAGQNIVAGG